MDRKRLEIGGTYGGIFFEDPTHEPYSSGLQWSFRLHL